MGRRRTATATAVALVVAVVALGGCRDEPSPTEQRADQVADAATDAGLGPEVAAILADAARGADGTYRVSYDIADPQDGGAVQHVTLTQRPPDRRLDVERDDGSAEVTIVRDGTSYQCTKGAGADWSCDVISDDAAAGGLFDDEAVANLTTALTAGAADYVFTVEDRQLVGVTAHCLVTRRDPAAADDPALGAEATLCLSDEGARLLTEVPGGTLRATAYGTDVGDDAFDLPATVRRPGAPGEEGDDGT